MAWKEKPIENEIWKVIPDCYECYEASSMGRIRKTKTGKVLKQSKMPNGYRVVRLHNISEQWYVHRLICKTFLENPDNKKCVNHKNGIKNDNRLENLEWCTHSENAEHAFRILNRKKGGQGRIGSLNGMSRSVAQFTIDGVLVAKYESIRRAEILGGYHGSSISAVCIGKLKTHKGFKWEHI